MEPVHLVGAIVVAMKEAEILVVTVVIHMRSIGRASAILLDL
jgi:hypothetical protein